jgi:carbon starvation protein
VKADPNKATPAKMYNDGVDFMPASSSVLFGYQFKSIAALGPIVGPIVAVQWGWLPALLWLILGVFFIGWVQDYTSAVMAMRNDGLTMGGLSYKLISPRARTILLSFLYFYLLLIMGAFGAISAGLFSNPKVAFGFIILTLAGVLSGQMTYKWRKDLIVTTLVCVGIAIVGIWLGTQGPFQAIVDAINGGKDSPILFATPYGPMKWSVFFWGIVVLSFCYLGSVLPIWRFAQPVNYVAFWLVLVGILGSIVGVFITGISNFGQMPSFGDFPAFTGFYAKGIIAPGVDTPLWPILFITIACGAIYGWHSLVSTSGTARQLEKETDALPVGAGAMFTETIMAVLAVVFAVTAFGGFKGYMEVLTKGGGPAVVFARGMAEYLNVLGIAKDFGLAFGSAFLVIMALTVMQLVLRFMRGDPGIPERPFRHHGGGAAHPAAHVDRVLVPDLDPLRRVEPAFRQPGPGSDHDLARHDGEVLPVGPLAGRVHVCLHGGRPDRDRLGVLPGGFHPGPQGGLHVREPGGGGHRLRLGDPVGGPGVGCPAGLRSGPEFETRYG